MSREELSASQGALYPALHRLEVKGFVKSAMMAAIRRCSMTVMLSLVCSLLAFGPQTTSGTMSTFGLDPIS